MTFKICIPFNSAGEFLGIYPEEIVHKHVEMYISSVYHRMLTIIKILQIKSPVSIPNVQQIHSLNKYLLSIHYYVPGTPFDTGDMAIRVSCVKFYYDLE